MKEKEQTTELQKTGTNMLATQSEAPAGFEDEEQGDFIIPRVKVIQTLSPERKDKIAEEGAILNSLTKEKLNGKSFVPVFKFSNNIDWKSRNDGGGMLCYSKDGKIGRVLATDEIKQCAICKRCEFDNTKQGSEAIPKCTKYINFFGFFEGERFPIILSFSKTSYNEGKKLFSLAKVTMQNMWHNKYVLNAKLEKKGNNEWYIPVVTIAGPASDEDRQFGAQLYKSFRGAEFKADLPEDENSAAAADEVASPDQLKKSEF